MIECKNCDAGCEFCQLSSHHIVLMHDHHHLKLLNTVLLKALHFFLQPHHTFNPVEGTCLCEHFVSFGFATGDPILNIEIEIVE